jgi:hypothetical protein
MDKIPRDFKKLLELLNAHKVDYLVVGSLFLLSSRAGILVICWF